MPSSLEREQRILKFLKRQIFITLPHTESISEKFALSGVKSKKIRSVTTFQTDCGYRWRKSLEVKLSCFAKKHEAEIFQFLRFRFVKLLIA